jgi:hypothetical protein
MLGYKNISVEFLTHTPILVWLGLAALIALAVYLYYRTNPPVPKYMRIILGALRIVAVLALIVALLEPVFSYSREFERKKRVSVIIDKSASMERVELGMSRSARLDSLLSGDSFSRLKYGAEIQTYYFGDNLETSPDRVRKDKTAIGDAVNALKTREVTLPADMWVLFSDGRSNSGSLPAEAAKGETTPILAVNLASELGGFDLALEDVSFNPVLFVGQPTDIKVTFNWRNAQGKRPTIQLLKGERTLAETPFPISEEVGTGETTLKYVPTEPGQELLKVNIPAMEGEESAANNSRTISVKVLKSRLLVLLVTERPDYEVGFLRRYLAQSDKYEVDLKVTGTKAGNLSGQFPSKQTELNRYDLVVLFDPDPQSLDGKEALLKSYLSERGGAVWVLMGPQFASRGPVQWFNTLLPFSQSTKRAVEYFEFHGEPAEANLFHPTVRLADDRTTIRETWAKLPPFKSLVRCDVVDPTSSVLAYVSDATRAAGKSPILGYRRFGPGKLLASAALPFWTWGFVDIGFGGDGAGYRTFIDGTTRWLTTRDDFDPIRITPEKEVFSRGEAVKFNGYAYDQGFRPITGVTGMVKLEDSERKRTFDADLIDRGEGHLDAAFEQLPPGKYDYTAVMQKDGAELKRNTGALVVEAFSLEEFDQSGDPATLQALARLSGGKYVTISDFDNAINDVDINPLRVAVVGETIVWNKFWLLLVFVGSLGVEWMLRKLNQLI